MQTENPVSERTRKAVVVDVFVFAGTAGFRPTTPLSLKGWTAFIGFKRLMLFLNRYTWPFNQ